ncbi:MAG: 50S ribosomal protein L18e [archaeon]|nr:50S ribosomal protein L18e [archaeon]
MRKTMAKKSTKELIVSLEKHGKKTKKKIWKSLAERLAKPTRIRAKVNVDKLNKLAKKQKGKIFVVPGKVLAMGVIDMQLNVACFEYSAKAKEKIESQKGKIISLTELIESKPKESEMVIVQ